MIGHKGGGFPAIIDGQRLGKDGRALVENASHADEQIARGATVGLLPLSCLEGFEQRIWNSENKSGHESLPEHQRF